MPIEAQFGLAETEVIQLMRENNENLVHLKMWRARVQGQENQTQEKSPEEMDSFKSRSPAEEMPFKQKISKR